MKRVISFFISICILMGAAFLPCAAMAEQPAATGAEAGETDGWDEPDTSAASICLLYEATTGTVLYEKSATRSNAPASMTKVMTAVLVLEYDPDLSGTLTAHCDDLSVEDWGYDPDHLVEGETVSVWDTMHYLLIASGNEAASSLACYVAGTQEKFVEMMNEKAAELGMENTRYVDPHGISGSPQRITAYDMLKLAQYAMTFPLFREIVDKTEGIMPASDLRSHAFVYRSTNRIKRTTGKPAYEVDFKDEVHGIKTGWIRASGYNFAGYLEHDGLEFYTVVMRGRDIEIKGIDYLGSFLATIELMKYARQFEKKGMFEGNELYLSVPGSIPGLDTVAASDASILARVDTDPSGVYTLAVKAGDNVKAGDLVGSICFEDSFGRAATTKLIAAHDVYLMPEWLPYVIIAGCVLIIAATVSLLIIRNRRTKVIDN